MESVEAREQLCRTYWSPLYHFIRRNGHGPEDAKDLTQAFFAVLLEKNFWERADPARGRFRSLLLKALTQFLHDQRDRANAAKRGKGVIAVSLDCEDENGHALDLPSPGATPEEQFNRNWAWSLLRRARERLRQECVARGKSRLYDSVDLFGDKSDAVPYAVMAHQLGMSISGLKTSVSRMRQRYGALVREEVARTVSRPEDVDAEIQFLFSVIAG
jgi:RNA polymerase sigma-70 factor (ECF subfamily)